MPPTTITFDNDALSNVVSTDKGAAELLELIQTHDLRVYIPGEVMNECFSGGSTPHVRARFERLHDIHVYEPFRFLFNRMTSGMIRAEAATSGGFKRTPIASVDTIRNSPFYYMDEGMRIHQQLQQDKLRFDAIRAKRVQDDHHFRDLAAQKFDPEEVRESIVNFNPETNTWDMRKMLFTDMSSLISRRKLHRALKDPRFKATRSLANLLAVQYLLVACTHPDPTLKLMRSIDESIWVDAFIAASAAYTEYFVTEDRRLRMVCNLLHERGAIGFRSVGWQDMKRIING